MRNLPCDTFVADLNASLMLSATEITRRHRLYIGLADAKRNPCILRPVPRRARKRTGDLEPPVDGCGTLRNFDGTCIDLCNPSRHEIFGEHLAHLPGRISPASDASRADALMLAQRFRSLQHRRNHNWTELFMPPLHFDGISGMIHQMSSWLVWALLHNRTYVPGDADDAFLKHVAGRDWSADVGSGGKMAVGCMTGRSFECIFEPLAPPLLACSSMEAAALKHFYATGVLARSLNMGWGGGEDANEVCYGSRETFAERGGFWLHAQAVKYVFRLRPLVEAAFARRRVRELGWDGDGPRVPTIGIHIRRGDKCGIRRADVMRKHGGLCDESYTAYRNAAQALQRRYGYRHIFLATDDTQAVAACNSWASFESCFAFDQTRRGENSVHNGDNSSAERTLNILLDIDTLSRCSAFIGAFTSTQVSNIAYELLVARRGAHVPFVNFGHWAWGDIDHGNDLLKASTVRQSETGTRTVRHASKSSMSSMVQAHRDVTGPPRWYKPTAAGAWLLGVCSLIGLLLVTMCYLEQR